MFRERYLEKQREKQVNTVATRYLQIKKILVEEGDKAGLWLLKSLVESCSNYVTHVARMEARKGELKNLETKEVIEELSVMDDVKRTYHNAIIEKLLRFNTYMFERYEEKTPLGGIFTLNPDLIKDRHVVGDWAGYLVTALRELEENL